MGWCRAPRLGFGAIFGFIVVVVLLVLKTGVVVESEGAATDFAAGVTRTNAVGPSTKEQSGSLLFSLFSSSLIESKVVPPLATATMALGTASTSKLPADAGN